MLYLVGLGLNDEKDISVKGMEAVQNSDIVYLEGYTSRLSISHEELEQFLGKNIIVLERAGVEEGSTKLIEESKKHNVCLLLVGDPLSATTHIEIYKEAREQGIECKIIHNASVLTAIAETGLQLYKFGRTSSIPFPDSNPNVITPYLVIKENKTNGLHTLLLLDLDPSKNKYLTINEAINYLLKIDEEKEGEVFTPATLCIACARLGGDTKIVSGMAEDIRKIDFGNAPFCLVIPGDLHFLEEEMINIWRIK